MLDELGQTLAALQLNVSLIVLEYNDHKQLVARTAAMEEMITKSIKTVQRISMDLQPVMPDILGLAEAMEWQAQEFQKRSGIPCKANIRLARKSLDYEVSTAILRVLKEALANVVNYSRATRVQVDLVERKAHLTLSVHNDGGWSKNGMKDVKSLNIAGMQERVNALGGKLRTCNSPKYGTAMFARIPLALKEVRDANQDSCCG